MRYYTLIYNILFAQLVLVMRQQLLLGVQKWLLAHVLTGLQKALNLSDAQLQDLLHVHNLLLVKSTLLDLERKAVVEPLIQPEQNSLPHDNFAALEADSNKLKDNLRQVTKVRLAAGTAVFAGVRSHV